MEKNDPKKRSRLRLVVGKLYFRSLRHWQWTFGNKKYASLKAQVPFNEEVAAHQSLLLRSLKNVDMWLQYNKIENLKIAILQLNGIVIQPGETLSYWKTIGKPTKRKGYKEGMVLFYGRFITGTGGGLCQLSNLIYWMTLHTPLTVTERHRHSYDVFPDSGRTLPFGSGATCVYNYRDLEIYNPTNEPYQLTLRLSEKELCGEWRSHSKCTLSYEVYEKKHWISHEYWGGYMRHNSIWRRVWDQGDFCINDELITENHALMMYSPFLEG